MLVILNLKIKYQKSRLHAIKNQILNIKDENNTLNIKINKF